MRRCPGFAALLLPQGLWHRAGPAAALCLLLVLPDDLLRAEDVLKLRDGRILRGRITALTSRNVVVNEANGKEESLPADEVASFTLDDAPPSLAQADRDAAVRAHDKALSGYRSAAEEVRAGKARQLHLQFIHLREARLRRARGEPREALSTLELLRRTCGDCRVRAESFRESLEVARSLKDPRALEGLLSEMEKEPEPLRGLAALERGRVHLERGEADQARRVFEALAADPQGPWADRARLGRLRALAAAKDSAELEKACRKVLEERSRPPALTQGAAALLSGLLLDRAGSSPGAGAAREAYLAAARALSLGPPSEEESSGEDYASALLAAARATSRLAAAASTTAARDEQVARAVSYYREVSLWFRNSGVADSQRARQAAAELGRLLAGEAAQASPPAR